MFGVCGGPLTKRLECFVFSLTGICEEMTGWQDCYEFNKRAEIESVSGK